MISSIKIRDIVEIIEDFAPLKYQESWDNSGLIIGDKDSDVKGVMLGFDCTPSLIEEAISNGCNMVVTHHPLIFRGIKNLVDKDDIVNQAIILAIKNDIAIYSAHTNIDKVKGGVSWAMAKRLNLNNIRVLEEEEYNVGLGVIGDLKSPMSSKDFIQYVISNFNLSIVRTSKPISKQISTVAMCGGSGASFINIARQKGADAYICGDISYHNFFVPEDFLVLDIGHYEGEVDVVDIFYELINNSDKIKKIDNFAVRISKNLEKSNPIYYFR